MTSRSSGAQARQLQLAIALAATLTIFGHYLPVADPWLIYVCKPLATALILALALAAAGAPSPRYRRAIAVGLLFSLAGDVFLMLPGDYFVQGLASFLVAHLAYLVAFTTDCRLLARPLVFAGWGLVGAVVLSVLWPGVPPELRVPVAVYVVGLLAMAAQAGARALVRASPGARLAALGGVFFVLSDALLAFDRFRAPFAAAPAVILGTYFFAQTLLARSVADGVAGGVPR
jgi:uncharacterized membrane protein YhhN